MHVSLPAKLPIGNPGQNVEKDRERERERERERREKGWEKEQGGYVHAN